MVRGKQKCTSFGNAGGESVVPVLVMQLSCSDYFNVFGDAKLITVLIGVIRVIYNTDCFTGLGVCVELILLSTIDAVVVLVVCIVFQAPLPVSLPSIPCGYFNWWCILLYHEMLGGSFNLYVIAEVYIGMFGLICW